VTEPNSLKSVLEQLAEAEKSRAEPALTSRQRRARTVARLAAVQALYQMELGGEGVDTVITEFSNHRFDADIEGEPLAEADEAYFAAIVRGVVGHQRAIAWELRESKDVPKEIVIDEYVELAKAFFDDAEAKFVNAALDGVARDVRG
jgi:N utilization substance protein B